MRLRRRHPEAYTIVDILMALTLLGLLVAIAWPRISMGFSVVRVRMAAGEVAGAMAEARIHAIRHQTKVALRFERLKDDTVTMTEYRDRDRDGVLSRDIERGVDTLEKASRRLSAFDGRVHFGFLYGEAPTEIGNPNRRIQRLMDPIRFGRSDMVSFNPAGTATPGSVYITDGYASLVAVRVDAMSGMISIWTYDKETELWRVGG